MAYKIVNASQGGHRLEQVPSFSVEVSGARSLTEFCEALAKSSIGRNIGSRLIRDSGPHPISGATIEFHIEEPSPDGAPMLPENPTG